MLMISLWRDRYARRMLFAVAFLVALDPLVVPVLRQLERSRYEGTGVFRFENSDLFGLGPVVEYLREHRRGERPRVVFFGNSVVWGYWLDARDTVPARFQELVPESRVFNFGVNGFESGSAYLITKAIVHAVDLVYLFPVGSRADPALTRLVPLSPADREGFNLPEADRLERSLEDAVGAWHLYRNSYRLQTSLFGTSTRVYLYLNKSRPLTWLWRSAAPAGAATAPGSTRAEVAQPVELDSGRSAERPQEERVRVLAAKYPLLWKYAELIRTHGKAAVIVEIADYVGAMEDVDRPDLNAHFHPAIRFVKLRVPGELRTDRIHLSPAGALAVARVLATHTAAPVRSPTP